HDKGRIWRILAGDASHARKPNLAKIDAAGLVAELDSANVWRRLTAQRLLAERGEKGIVPALEKLCREGKTQQGRLNALYTLDGLNALEPGHVEGALSDPHYGVRFHALELAERWLDKQPALLTKAVALAEDPHFKVRLQLAFSLGETQDAKGLEAL